jgi:hypothetical protein
MIRRGPGLLYGVKPYLGLLDVLPENGAGRRENSTGRDAVVLTCESECTKAFRRADDQAQRPSKTVRCGDSLDNEYELTPISGRIVIAWEKGEEALELPSDVAFRARWITY